jgi:small-conductance mechanosensitive channel
VIGAEEVSTAQKILVPVGSVVGGVLVALLLAVVIGALVRSIARRSTVAADLARRAKRPLRAVLVVIAVWVALLISVPDATWDGNGWMSALEHVLLIALIAAATWLVGTLAFVVEDVALARYRVDVKDNRHARRVRTQVQLLRRITVAVLVVVAVAAVLLTFPGVSAFGASLLASAGVLSIVAGLAAQSSLANVFAGLQLAFTDAIRVDDVVIVEEEWGRIEEITLTYVVVHVWDDRRLILPSTYFTQTPFENWTRRAAELLGTVELDVDWQVPVDAMRGELNRLLAETDLWDHRVGILQVTDAVGGTVRLRALASAVDAPTLFDLRCYLREGLVAWLQQTAPQGLPRTRVETSEARALPETPALPTLSAPTSGAHAAADAVTGQQDARLFTGSVEAMERSKSFTGPGQDVIDEREEHAAGARDPEPDEPPRAPRSTEPRSAPIPAGVIGSVPAPTGAVVASAPDAGLAPEGAATDVPEAASAPEIPADRPDPSPAAPAPAAPAPAPEPEAPAALGRRVSSTPGTDTATGQTPAVPTTPSSAPPGPAPITVPGRGADAPEPLALPGEEPPFADTQRLRTDDLAAGAQAGAETGGTMVLPPVPGAPTSTSTPPAPPTEAIATAPDADEDAPDPAAPPTRRSVRDESRDLDR